MGSAATVRSHRDRVLDQLDEFSEIAADPALLALERQKISHWSIGQHLRHLLLAADGILDLLEKAEPKESLAGQGPNLIGRCLLLAGFIPRGKGKAPEAVTPIEPELETLAADLATTRRRFAALDPSALRTDQAVGRHFVFGALDPAQWLRFVVIHHHHHGQIIRDIRRAGG